MTLEEAQAVADIVATADNGCSSCVGSLCRMLAQDFPQFTWTFHPDLLDRFLDDDEDSPKAIVVAEREA